MNRQEKGRLLCLIFLAELTSDGDRKCWDMTGTFLWAFVSCECDSKPAADVRPFDTDTKDRHSVVVVINWGN